MFLCIVLIVERNLQFQENRNLYSIRCGTKSARKFIELIKPHCPDLECFRNTKFKKIVTDSSFLISKFKH